MNVICESRFSNLVDPAEWPKNGLLNRGFGIILLILPRKKQENTEFTQLSSVRTQKFTKFNSVHTRRITKTSGFTRGVCKNRGFY